MIATDELHFKDLWGINAVTGSKKFELYNSHVGYIWSLCPAFWIFCQISKDSLVLLALTILT